LTAFFKFPISWFQSRTIAFRPDETHQSIRRTFAVPARDHLRHQFCGYCGTQLLIFDDSSRTEDGYISLTLGSLIDDDVDRLIELGLFDQNDGSEDASNNNKLINRGNSWFEELVEGKTRRQKGGEISTDGSTMVEWEVIEFDIDPPNSGTNVSTMGKRKLEQVESGSSEAMQH
jgi:hypothetical protein